MQIETKCPLCIKPDDGLLWRGERVRVIQVDDPHYPGYCRVVWNAHVKEMSDLSAADRSHLWAVIDVVERALRDMLEPEKINLASLGNQVPHLHWHVIPRWRDDRHYPDPIWAAPRNPEARAARERSDGNPWARRQQVASNLQKSLGSLLQASFPW